MAFEISLHALEVRLAPRCEEAAAVRLLSLLTSSNSQLPNSPYLPAPSQLSVLTGTCSAPPVVKTLTSSAPPTPSACCVVQPLRCLQRLLCVLAPLLLTALALCLGPYPSAYSACFVAWPLSWLQHLLCGLAPILLLALALWFGPCEPAMEVEGDLNPHRLLHRVWTSPAVSKCLGS